jgi:hypothetical protein
VLSSEPYTLKVVFSPQVLKQNDFQLNLSPERSTLPSDLRQQPNLKLLM